MRHLPYDLMPWLSALDSADSQVFGHNLFTTRRLGRGALARGRRLRCRRASLHLHRLRQCRDTGEPAEAHCFDRRRRYDHQRTLVL